MPCSQSTGDNPLSGVEDAPGPEARATAQSTPSGLVPVDEHARPPDAQATPAARGYSKLTTTSRNVTPQLKSSLFWGTKKEEPKSKKKGAPSTRAR